MRHRQPHKISIEEMEPQTLVMASADTADGTQRKRLYARSIPLEYVVARRYFEGGDPEQEIKVTTNLQEAIESYNRLG